MQSLPGVTATEMLRQEDWDTADGRESMMSSAIKLVISAAKPDRESISPRADKSDSNDGDINMNPKVRKERNMKFVQYIRKQMMHEYGVDLQQDDD